MISFEIFAEVDRIPQRARIFEKSGSHRCLIEGPTVWLPSKRVEMAAGRDAAVSGVRLPGGLRAMVVEVGPEIEQLVFRDRRRPEQSVIKYTRRRVPISLSTNGGTVELGDGLDSVTSSIRRLACH